MDSAPTEYNGTKRHKTLPQPDSAPWCRPVDSASPSGPGWEVGLTSQGSAHGRFSRAIAQRNLWAAEVAAKEIGGPPLSLLDALDYLALVAEVRPEKLEPAAIRWHGRFELESAVLTLTESQLALSALAALGSGDREVMTLLRGLLRRAQPTVLPRLGR